jgi:hypothetical protein
VTPFTIDLHTQSYRFLKGHRIMVQVQSTWFPIIDRNPQTWVPNIFLATEKDFKAQTHKVWRTPRQASRVEIQIVPAMETSEIHPSTGFSGRQAGSPDLTGIWLPGSGPEPSAARLTMTATCQSTPAYWYIEQRGDSVSSWTNPASFNQGIARPPRPRPVTAVGTISGLDVAMSDGSSRYRLRYDRTSGHLRGTLNDKPFWAIPEDFTRPTGCLPAP